MSKFIKNKKGGFVILFAVTLSSIVLAIALGVANISVEEIKFGTSARETNNAFFAADTGVEYVLYLDKMGQFVPDPQFSWETELVDLNGDSCAIVTIEKDPLAQPQRKVRIVSKGYNKGDPAGPGCDSATGDRIEREILVTYPY